MTINTNKEIINYIINFAKTARIDLFSHLGELEIAGDKIDALEKYLFPDEKVDMKAADQVSLVLGINNYDLLHCNEERLTNYIESYDYFRLYKEFEEKANAHSNENVVILVRFPQIKDLINAYIEMCEDYIGLFTRSLTQTLHGQEIELFNFLAAVLNAYDVVTSGLLNISYVNNYLHLYREEIKDHNLTDIVEFFSIWDSDLWRCIDLLDSSNELKELAKYDPLWSNSVKNDINKTIEERKSICVAELNASGAVILLNIEREIWIKSILLMIELIKEYSEKPKDRLIKKINDDAEKRREARANVIWSSMLPQTFDQIDYIERECNISKAYVNLFFDARWEFENITSLDEDDDPEEYLDAMITYVAGAMGLTYDDAMNMYDKEREFLDNY